MARYNFNLRSPSSSRPSAIHLVIRYNGQRVVFPTSEHIHPKYWESDKSKRSYQRAKKSLIGSPELNHRLEQIEIKARNVFRSWLVEHDDALPAPQELLSALNDAFKRNTEPTMDTSFLGFIRAFISNSSSRTNPSTGRPPSARTISKYQTTLKHLDHYAKSKKVHLTWDSIDLRFYDDWTNWMRTDLDMATNTVGKYIRTLKTFMNAATEEGINTNRTYQSARFRSLSEEADTISLNEEELDALCALDLSDNPRLERIRDLFLVGAWTGLRFSDLHQVSPANISNGYLKVHQEKTDQPVVIPVLPVVQAFLDKYEGELPAPISNQRFNQYLKEVCRLCPRLQDQISLRRTKGGQRTERQLSKADAITTHTARRSFASNLYRRGLPSISIMAITGHRTEKQFLKYIKIRAEEHATIITNSLKNQHSLSVQIG